MRRYLIIICLAFLAFSCSTPKVSTQDGSSLWFANSRTYNEVLGSVTTKINPNLGNEEFHIYDSNSERIIESGNQNGIRYGVYELQRLETLGKVKKGLDITKKPYYDLRILNHWDNLDDTVERGYAGLSMWEWTANDIPEERIHKYGELCASIGINGSVLNNVNSNPLILDREHLERVAKIANILREYGIKTYLSIKWTSPISLSGLKSGDPLDPAVRAWWADKAKEIYSLVPDFGGFLVKANSEGQAGPQDYGRTHADGANMLASALEPYGGIVMWRAFVYDPQSPDRANQAVEEFKSLDGKFADNAIIQIKNGPVDFQPREPFSPLFGQMKESKTMIEFQITQEYLGFSNHLAYHGTTWEECLKADTYRDGEGSSVSKVISAIAGVANTGQDANFSGYIFAQANWYAFGRMAWDPSLAAEEVADEWIRLTFNCPSGLSAKAFERKFIEPVKEIMMESREAVVNYEMPLGIHHAFGGSHYGPGPWERSVRPDWSPVYYHKADNQGIGFDRTRNGSKNVDQYHEPLASMYNDPKTCPDELILWFHHLPWDYTMRSGRSLWDEICLHYDTGIKQVENWQKTWKELEPYVSQSIFNEVSKKLDIQHNDAQWWRDACVGYFQTFSQRPLPNDVDPLSVPIDSLINRSILSDRYGLPTHDSNNRPVIRKPFRRTARTLPGHDSSF